MQRRRFVRNRFSFFQGGGIVSSMGKSASVHLRKTQTARRIARVSALAQLLLILSVLCWAGGVEGGNVMSMEVTSPAFVHEGPIPVKFTCDGLDLSPALSWRGFPEKTAGFALVCVDPDAPAGTWVHWVMYNIPGSFTEMPEGAAPGKAGVSGMFGVNSWGVKEYGGPCPAGRSASILFQGVRPGRQAGFASRRIPEGSGAGYGRTHPGPRARSWGDFRGASAASVKANAHLFLRITIWFYCFNSSNTYL